MRYLNLPRLKSEVLCAGLIEPGKLLAADQQSDTRAATNREKAMAPSGGRLIAAGRFARLVGRLPEPQRITLIRHGLLESINAWKAEAERLRVFLA